jgi:hypothetical protein
MPELVVEEAERRNSKVESYFINIPSIFIFFIQTKRVLKRCCLCQGVYKRIDHHLMSAVHNLGNDKERYKAVKVRGH